MLESRGFIKLVVCMDEAQLREKPLRCDIFWIVTRKYCLDPEISERMLDYPCRRLECVALPPVAGHDVDAEFGDQRIALAHSEPAASDMLVGRQKEDRPILDAVGAMSIDFELEPNLHFAQCVAARRDIPRDHWVAPETDGEPKIGVTPAAETEPRRPQEVIVHAATGRLAFDRRGRHRFASDSPLDTNSGRHVFHGSIH